MSHETHRTPPPGVDAEEPLVPGGQARYRAMFDSAPIGQVFTTLDGRITLVNRTLAELLGHTRECMTGRPALDFVIADEHDDVHATTAALRGGEHRRVDARRHFRHRDGHAVPVRVVSTLLPGDDGLPRWWASMVVDLSAEERARARIERSHANATRAATRMRLLHRVATAANEAGAIDELPPSLLAAICAHFGWTAGALVRWSPGATGATTTARSHIGAGPADWTVLGALPIPAAGTRLVRHGGHCLLVVPLEGMPDEPCALVFFGVPGEPVAQTHEVLAVIVGECERVIERERAARQLRASEAKFRSVFAASPLPMGVTVGDTGVYSSVNAALCEMLGRTADELVGTSAREIAHPGDHALLDPAGAAAAAAPDSRHCCEVRLLHSSGAIVVTVTTLTWLTGTDGTRLLLAQFEDITAQRTAELALKREAEHDALTGLANRFHLARELERLSGSRCAALFLDLDAFKLINDANGHEAGDEVLVEVARRLRSLARDEDVVARFGGDEFVIICVCDPAGGGRPGGREPALAARRVADRIEAELARPIRTSAGLARLSASIGIATGVIDAAGPQNLVQRADTAMYHAKRTGKNRSAVYDARLHRQTVEYQHTEALLRDALGEHRVVVHYQPIVDIDDASIVGFEALVRLRDTDGAIVAPDRFIGVAEQTGLIVPIGSWVLAEACRTIARLSARAGRALSVAVNVAARQAARPDLAGIVDAALAESGLAPSELALELTESALLEADDATLRQLTELREKGVHIGLDDFGTGYSSLTYLRSLPVSHVKVDRSFVTDMTTDSGDAAIVRAVTRLASDLGLYWVAEGIETDEQWDALRSFGPGLAQGYLFSRPLSAEVLDHILRVGTDAGATGDSSGLPMRTI